MPAIVVKVVWFLGTALHPNGTCTTFDQSVFDRDTYSDHSGFGVYFIGSSSIEADIVYYHHSHCYDPDTYFQILEKMHYSFERLKIEDSILVPNNKFRNCCAGLPVILNYCD